MKKSAENAMARLINLFLNNSRFDVLLLRILFEILVSVDLTLPRIFELSLSLAVIDIESCVFFGVAHDGRGAKAELLTKLLRTSDAPRLFWPTERASAVVARAKAAAMAMQTRLMVIIFVV